MDSQTPKNTGQGLIEYLLILLVIVAIIFGIFQFIVVPIVRQASTRINSSIQSPTVSPSERSPDQETTDGQPTEEPTLWSKLMKFGKLLSAIVEENPVLPVLAIAVIALVIFGLMLAAGGAK